jgi:hypothetical protein
MDPRHHQAANRGASFALAEMGPRHSLALLALGFERAQFRFLLGKQLLDHRPLARVGFRREYPAVVLDVQASYVLR